MKNKENINVGGNFGLRFCSVKKNMI